MVRLVLNGKRYEVEQFTFNGGEVHVKLNTNVNYAVDNILVEALIRNSEDLMALFLTYEALRGVCAEYTKIDLDLPYLPYARQDRRCLLGEAESLKVIIRMIDSLGFDTLYLTDVHNESSMNYFYSTNVEYKSQTSLFRGVSDFKKYEVGVYPDKGAFRKRVRGIFPSEVVGDKVRDLQTGEIKGISLDYKGDNQFFEDSNFLIVDDICDGGRTFVEVAKQIRKDFNVKSIGLYVTHGIFSKGLSVFDGLIDKVYTTNSFYRPNEEETNVKIEVIDLFKGNCND